MEKSQKTNGEFIRGMTDNELSHWLAKTFCHGYGQPDLFRWLRLAHGDESGGARGALGA